MHFIKMEKITVFALMMGVYLFAWFLQDKFFLNWDISQLLHATELMLSGGTYSQDFFIPNPPMILFLYTPPVLISKLLGIKIIIPFRFYIFFLTSISLVMSYYLTELIFTKKDTVLRILFIISLAIILLALQFYQLGQRDCLLLVFAMPYLLTVALRLENKTINTIFAISIGLFAGLGFAIKPQFLMMPCLIECYFMYCKKSWFGWVRTENIAIALLLITYAFIVWTFFPDYIFTIIPYMLHNYYSSLNLPWFVLIFHPLALFCGIPIVFYILLYKSNRYLALSTVLMLALIGLFISYYSQHTVFLYHILPAFLIAFLLLTLLLGIMMTDYCSQLRDYVFTTILVIMLFSLCIPTLSAIYKTGTLYKQNVLANLTTFMHSFPAHQSIYVFSVMTNYSAPLMHYIDIKTAGRFDCLWMAAGLTAEVNLTGENAVRQYIKNNRNKQFFINMIVEDLQQQKPDLIFVDTREYNVFLHGIPFHLDYLSYFLENNLFRNEWNHYQYLTTISGGDISAYDYKLEVYQRIKG